MPHQVHPGDQRTAVRKNSFGTTPYAHAVGFKKSDESGLHPHLNSSGGFRSVEIDRIIGSPAAFFRNHGFDGVILNEDIRFAD